MTGYAWPARASSVILVALFLVLGLSNPAVGAPTSSSESACGPPSATESNPAVRKAEPVRVEAVISETPTINIKRTNRAGDVEVTFKSASALPDGLLNFDVSRFRNGSQRIDPKAVAVTIDRRGDKEVRVDVCVDRNAAKVRAGAYTGSVIIRDARLLGADIPLNLNIQDHRLGWIGGIGLLLASIVGVMGVWITVRRAAGEPSFGAGAWAALKAWSKVHLVFTVAVACGAAWAAFQTQGLSDNEFAGDLVSYVQLFLIMFAAAYAAGNLPPAFAGKGGHGGPPPPPNAE